jgi:hypothetical protein
VDEDAVDGVGHDEEREMSERWRRLKAYVFAVWQAVEGGVVFASATDVSESILPRERVVDSN